MSSRKVTVTLLALGNFSSSVAGGLVLAKGLDLIAASPFAFADSLLAYLVGSFLSFYAIVLIRRSALRITWCFSAAGAGLALTLSPLFQAGAIQGRGPFLFYFMLLCFFFACTSVPRALRSDLAAFRTQALSLVELAYSAGYLCGLGLTRMPFFPQGLGILHVGSVLLGVAAFADLSLSLTRHSPSNSISAATFHRVLSGRLVNGIVLFFSLTAAIQIGAQRLASLANMVGPLIAFEVGVTLAPLFCVWLALSLETPADRLFDGRIVSERFFSRSLSFVRCVKAVFVAMFCGVFLFWLGPASQLSGLVLLGLAAFAYEAASLLLLQWLGKVEGAVSLAFAVNGLLCSALYGSLLHTPGGFFAVLILTVLGLSVTSFMVRQRPTALESLHTQP